MSLTLKTASGSLFAFSGPVGGFYTPLDFYYNGMQKVGPNRWVELHPDGFQILYGLIPESSSSSGSSQSASSESSENSRSSLNSSILFIPCNHSSSSSGSSGSSSSSSSSSSMSSGSSSSSSSAGCPPIEPHLGFQQNLIPPTFSVPYVGAPVKVDRDNEAGQPPLCTVEQDDLNPVFSLDGLATAMDRATEITKRLGHGFNLLDRYTGSNTGNPIVSAQVNLSSLNLLISVRLPSAGTAAPPLVFHYNSLSEQGGEYGFGWSTLYQSQVTQVPTHGAEVLFFPSS